MAEGKEIAESKQTHIFDALQGRTFCGMEWSKQVKIAKYEAAVSE